MFARTPGQQRRVMRAVAAEWKSINAMARSRAIQRLYTSKLVAFVDHKDGTSELILTEKGQRLGLRYDIDRMEIVKPASWDKKWRAVIFDIPEKEKKLRDAFRYHVKRLGFYELQKSVLIHPYECHKEIEFIIEFYDARRYIRVLEVTHIDNALHLRKKFNLLN